MFLGVGSILGVFPYFNQSEKTKKIVVFGAGYGYGQIPQINNKYDIFFVRGPLTAKILNLDRKYGLSDSAILVKALSLPKEKKIYRYSYMPHWTSEFLFDWEKLCTDIGINYISPGSDVKQVIKQISETETLITEAMHGAIVADALRVPWIPVRAYNFINIFKWTDWCTSINVKYSPNPMLPLADMEHTIDSIQRYNSRDFEQKPNLFYLHLANESYSSPKDIELARETLSSMRGRTPFLSSEARIENITSSMLDKLQSLKMKYGHS